MPSKAGRRLLLAVLRAGRTLSPSVGLDAATEIEELCAALDQIALLDEAFSGEYAAEIAKKALREEP